MDIHPACALCKGACCESFAIPERPFNDGEGDTNDWIQAHADIVVHGMILVQRPCKHLANGLCSIYPDRFTCCKEQAIGSVGCLLSIQCWRLGEEADAILALID